MSRARLAAKVDAAGPAVVVIVTLIVHKAAVLDDLPVQPKDVDGQVVAASIAALSAFQSPPTQCQSQTCTALRKTHSCIALGGARGRAHQLMRLLRRSFAAEPDMHSLRRTHSCIVHEGGRPTWCACSTRPSWRSQTCTALRKTHSCVALKVREGGRTS